MKRALSLAARVALAAAAGLVIAALASDTQTPAATRAGAMSVSSDMAPATPRDGSPETSAAPTSVSPTSAEACSNGGWRVYARPKFSSQRSCEAWARRHATSTPIPASPSREDQSSGAEVRTAIPFLV